MRYPIPGTESLSISKDKRFFDNGQECDLPIIDDKVTVRMYGEIRTLDVEWLLNLSVFGINLPSELINKTFTSVVFIKCIGKARGWPYLPKFTTPMYVGEDKEYKIIPMFSRYAINKNGVVIEIRTLKEVPKLYYDYVYCNIYDNRVFKNKTIGVHRLLCYAWLDNSDLANRFYINHKNGDTHDYRLTNLEWVTPKENNDHAVQNGLRNDNVPHRLRDIVTGEIKEFPSATLAYAYAKKTCGSNRILTNKSYSKQYRVTKLLLDRFEVRRVGDETPWYYLDTNNPKKNSRYLIDVTNSDGTTKRYHGTMELVSDFKIWNEPTYEVNHVVGGAKSRYPDKLFKITDQYDTREVERKSLLDGKITIYPTIVEHSRDTGIHKTTILRATQSEGTKAAGDYLFRRKTEDPWPTKYTLVGENTFRTKVFYKNTNEEKTYSSLREAAKSLNIDRQAVTRMINRPKSSDKYIISYLKDY